MTLRIRELVIRAEIGDDTGRTESRNDVGRPHQDVRASETGSMTRRFYEQDKNKDNER